jgi:hypothetical protein
MPHWRLYSSRRNHLRIGACIQKASLALLAETRLPWALSRDWFYQMSNRFAWAWKLAELGRGVILDYIGFLGCRDIHKEPARHKLRSDGDWQQLVENHSQSLIPSEVWNRAFR